ncbi:hypothetical protein [Streptomyces xiamenensis]|uniref:hypothetical protein n=1 Tax=Streptomyces xiamenensis TaxID=408015 RepID=UPI003D765DEE
MNTTAAAAQAEVTVATIRTWCRMGAVAAVKAAGRWVIEAASLARRIAIGQERRRMTELPPINLTSHTRQVRGHIGVVGAAAVLKSAYEAGQQVTLAGKYAGERVYLGHSRQTYGDYGITMETIGCDRELPDGHRDYPGVPCAVYLLDMSRLDEAPRLAAYIAEVRGEEIRLAAEAEERAARAEDEYLNPRYM